MPKTSFVTVPPDKRGVLFRPLHEMIDAGIRESIDPGLPRYLREPIHYFLDSPGKKIRPLLTLLCCDALGGDIQKALPAAIAVELLHDFTLVHDDIMDRDDLRRGRQTIHVKWDESTAILAGDALIGLAYQKLMKSPAHLLNRLNLLFSEAIVRVCEGQALDKEFEDRESVSLEEYEKMIGLKTAWLLKVSCQLGAVIGGGTEKQIAALAEFGFSLGMGFQVQDDLLDFTADQGQLGKKVGSDYRMHKKTFVTLYYNREFPTLPEKFSNFPEKADQFDSFTQFREALTTTALDREMSRIADGYIQSALQTLSPVIAPSGIRKLQQFTALLRRRRF